MQLKLFFLSFFVSISLFCQTIGLVTDIDGKPIESVRVYIADQDVVTYTNEYGEFSFSSSIPVNTTFEFKKIGYSTKLYKQTRDELKVYLEKLHVELDEVGIIAKSQKLGEGKTISIETKSLNNNFISCCSYLHSLFLDAPSHLYKRVCLTVRPSVRPSARPSVTI